ncbi:MAG TPA: RNA 2',3'-cyclic phosphodiesterase [Verrucomicrobiae bacterium]|nr:RNA 2',3'-cyclic phosphodiesterase [Verrucomicrobiae bacterium]
MNPPGAPEPVRAFIAIAVPQMLVEQLKQLQRQLEADVGGDAVRWTKPDQLHLTLKFLGNVRGDGVNDLKSALTRACAGRAPFQLTLEGLGCFPNTRTPRVVWVGITGELKPLEKLQMEIDRQTQTFGDHTEERPFQPHLTIGRVKVQGKDARRLGEAVERTTVFRPGAWLIREVELIQSKLAREGANYSTLASAHLMNGNGKALTSPSSLDPKGSRRPQDR